MQFLIFLTYRKTFHLNEPDSVLVMPPFGAVSGASFNFTFLNDSTDSFFVGLMNHTKYGANWNFSFDYKSLCINPSISFTLYSTVLNNSYEKTWTKTISEAGMYSPVVVSCQSSTIDTYVYAEFHNIKTYLDTTYGHCYIFAFVYGCVIILLIGIIIFAINCNHNIKLKIHIILISTCILSFLNLCVDTAIKVHIDKFGFAPILFKAINLTFAALFITNLNVSTFMIAAGWSIDTNYYNVWRLVFVILLSPFTHSFVYYRQFYGVNEFIVVPFFIQFIALYLIFWLIIQQLHSNEIKLMSYEFLIETLGYKPSSTIVSKKLIRSYAFLILVLLFMVFKMSSIVVFYFVHVSEWITSLFYFILDHGFLTALIFLSIPYNTSLKVFKMFFDDKDAYQDLERKFLDPMKFVDAPLRDWNEHEDTLLIPPILQKLLYTATDFEIQQNDEPLLVANI